MWLDRPAPACVVHTDIAAPSYYLVPQRFGQAWFGSTVEDAGFHDWTTDAGYAELIDAAREIDPRISDASVIDIWSGLRPRALRLGGPYLGAWPGIENLWLACGHFKSGVLTGPPSASLLAEAMVDGRPIDADFSLEAAQRE
jgi:glycine oxidase